MVAATGQISTLIAAIREKEQECNALRQQLGGKASAPVQQQV